MGCFSGYLVSSAGNQKLFCGIYSAFKCSFDEFVGEKMVSPSYSSAILGPPLFFISDAFHAWLTYYFPLLDAVIGNFAFPQSLGDLLDGS